MTDYPESFADFPKTFGEKRAQAATENTALLWKPRDVLIDMLRRIDSGAINVDALVIAYRKPGDVRGSYSGGYLQASPDNFTAIGILECASHMIKQDATE